MGSTMLTLKGAPPPLTPPGRSKAKIQARLNFCQGRRQPSKTGPRVASMIEDAGIEPASAKGTDRRSSTTAVSTPASTEGAALPPLDTLKSERGP